MASLISGTIGQEPYTISFDSKQLKATMGTPECAIPLKGMCGYKQDLPDIKDRLIRVLNASDFKKSFNELHITPQCDLKAFDLDDNERTKKLSARLAPVYLEDPNTTELDLFGLHTDDTSVLAITQMLETSATIKRLHIGQIGGKALTTKSTTPLAEMLKTNSTLAHLHIRYTGIGDEGVKPLAEVLKKPTTTLVSLDLTSNLIGHEGAKALAESLKTNNKLKRVLDLTNNPIGDMGAKALASMLEENTPLGGLYLENCNISDDGGEYLARAIEKNKRLRVLKLDAKTIGDKTFEALIAASKTNQSLSLEIVNDHLLDKGRKQDLQAAFRRGR